MSIKEEIHALTDEMLTNLEDWLPLILSLGHRQRECLLEKDLQKH